MSASHREHIESEVVVFVRGEIDMASSSQLWDEIEASVVPGTKHLVLDLSEVSFIDAFGVSVIARAWAYLGGDAKIVLRRPRPLVRQIFEIVNLDEFCRIEPAAESGNDLEPSDDLSTEARSSDLPDVPHSQYSGFPNGYNSQGTDRSHDRDREKVPFDDHDKESNLCPGCEPPRLAPTD